MRIVLITLLTVGVTAGAAVLSLRKSCQENPEKERIDFLVRSLGDRNPDIRRKAEAELRQLGPKALEAVRSATRSTDPGIAERAMKLLRDIEGAASDSTATGRRDEPKPEETRKTPEPDPRGVTVELVPSSEIGKCRFYVRITNHDAAPYFVARDRAAGRVYYGRF